MPLHHPSRMAPPQRLTTNAFFATSFPKLLAARASHCRAVGGAYLFEVVGDGGGAWVVDFESLRVEAPSPRPVRFHLTTDTETFERLLAGEIDVSAAARAQKIRFSGDIEAIANVATVMAA